MDNITPGSVLEGIIYTEIMNQGLFWLVTILASSMIVLPYLAVKNTR